MSTIDSFEFGSRSVCLHRHCYITGAPLLPTDGETTQTHTQRSIQTAGSGATFHNSVSLLSIPRAQSRGDKGTRWSPWQLNPHCASMDPAHIPGGVVGRVGITVWGNWGEGTVFLQQSGSSVIVTQSIRGGDDSPYVPSSPQS